MVEVRHNHTKGIVKVSIVDNGNSYGKSVHVSERRSTHTG